MTDCLNVCVVCVKRLKDCYYMHSYIIYSICKAVKDLK